MKKNQSTCPPVKKIIKLKGLNPLFPDSTSTVCVFRTSNGRHYIGALDPVVTVSIQPVESLATNGFPNEKSKWAVFITDQGQAGSKRVGRTIIKSNSSRAAGLVPPNEKLKFPRTFSHISAVISD